MKDVETQYKEITGKEISHFYRPPQGKYNLENLKMAKNLGYHTFFWSLAYVDWYENDQPTKEEAFDKLLSRIHPGAIVLLHNTSKTNGEILDDDKYDFPQYALLLPYDLQAQGLWTDNFPQRRKWRAHLFLQGV